MHAPDANDVHGRSIGTYVAGGWGVSLVPAAL